MDARALRCLAVAFWFAAGSLTTDAATHQTVNFAVTAKRQEVAEAKERESAEAII